MSKKITALMLALAMVLALVPGVTVTASGIDYLDDYLVLHYSFDADSAQPDSITDDSGNGYNGTVLNTVEQGNGSPWGGGESVSNVLTIEGGLAHFPGSSSTTSWGWGGQTTQYHTGAAIKIPQEIKEQITDSFTVTMWVKADTSYEYHTGLQRLFDFGRDTRDSIFLRYQGGDPAQLRFQDRGIASGADDEKSYVAGNTSVAEGQWALITTVYDAKNGNVRIYVNNGNNSIASRNISKFRSIVDVEDVANDTYGFFIGRTQWWNDSSERANNPDFGGWIDDVRIYNRAFVSEDVYMLYHATYHAPDMKTIVDGTSLNYRVKQGESPSLPGSVGVSFDDGTTGRINVVWDEIPEDMLNTIGSFTVRGTAAYNGIDYGKIMSAVITVTSSDGDLESGLEVYYSFENDWDQPTSIYDDSGNSLNGQVLNNNDRWDRRQITTEEVSGGRVANFPGGTWRGNGAAIKIPEDIKDNITGDYTVSMWVKADSSYSFSGNLQRFFDFGSGTYDSIFVRYKVTDGDLRFQDRGIASGADDQNSYISTNNYSFVDQWGLLTVTYTAEDNTATVYVNGDPVMNGSKFTRTLGDIPTPGNNYGLLLGRTMWQDGDNPDFCGKMDEVRIYSRALSEGEINELYLTTCPEPMVTISITHQLEDGTIVEELAPTAVAEGASYTYDAPATIEYEGKIYSLSYSLSTLSIKNAGGYNNKITAVYVIKTAVGQEAVLTDAYINTKPQLPGIVSIVYNTGENTPAEVQWMNVPDKGWSEIGEHEVNGEAEGFPVTATVTVYEITGTNVPETIYADLGSQPELPAVATVYTSHGRTLTSDIIWDKLPADKAANGENFEISGYLADFPDVTVTAMVEFILRAVINAPVVADTYTTDGDRNTTRYGSEEELVISSNSGSGRASYNRYAFLRFENPVGKNTISAKLKLFMTRIDNGAYTEYTLYAMNNSDWEENDFIWSWQHDYIADAEEIARTSYRPTSSPETVNDWLEFDVSDYIINNPGKEYYDFYITASTCASYFSSREGNNPPVLEINGEGKELMIRYTENGAVVKSEKIAVPKSGPYTYVPAAAIVHDGRLYVPGGSVEIPETAYVDEIEIPLTEKEFEVEVPVVSTYYDEAPVMPKEVKIVWDDGKMSLPAEFETTAFDDLGTYTVYGTAEGLEVPATVKAYGRYYNDKGVLLGYAGRVNVAYRTADGRYAADTVPVSVRVGTSFDAETMIGYYPQLVNDKVVENVGIVTEPEHFALIEGTLVDGVSGFMGAELSGDDPSDYAVSVSAVAANTAEGAAKAMIIIVKYDEDGKMVEFKTASAALEEKMTGRTKFEFSAGYDREAGEDIRIYLWDLGQVRPIYEAVRVSELPEPKRYSDEILALIPEYDSVKENVLRANDYRQNTWGPNTVVNNIDTAFWDTAAYHTGNMEVYKTFGGEDYLDYSFNWANGNGWKGNNYGGDPSNWTWGYNQSQGSNAVLFGDWQICFQTYLDLYTIDPERANIDRVIEVIDYQMSIDPAVENRGGVGYWWWADALYMVPPVFTKLYSLTGNEKYLDKLYEYYRFAAELMYDGESGIPTSADGYTTAAGRAKNGGSYYSDPDNYAHLFYRDAGYVYPLNPNSGHAGEKNFWARGNGWVFAGLAKILSDMPENYEHRDFFVTIYNEMAEAIINCQMQDDEGRGFWTQSMLQNYPVGNNGNDWGYETSGTAFLTYGLFWGLNSGMLNEDTYLEPALRGWKYLSEIALQDSGKVGYCQPIGSNATQATPWSTDQPFGYGAFLLAGCEASRWVAAME